MSSSPTGLPSAAQSPGALLEVAASTLENAANCMQVRKDVSSEMKRLCRELAAMASGVASAVVASCDSASAAEIPLSAEPVVACATDVFIKCAIHVRDWQPRFLRQYKLKDELEACKTACQAFRDILGIVNGRSLLIDGDSAISFPRPPGWKEDTSDLGERISTAHTVYQGFKILLTALVNAGDGARMNLGADPIQPKAFSQLVLQMMKHVEDFTASKDDVEKLQSSVESTWDVISEHYRRDPGGDGALDGRVRKVLRLLMRIVVRLHLLRETHCIKRFVALATVKDIVAEETIALSNAKAELTMALSFSSRAVAAEHRGEIRTVGEQVVRHIDDGMEASGRKLDGIAARGDDKDFQLWLGSTYDFESRQHELQRQIDEKFDWILSDPQFLEWKATQGIYWISSTPGAGKSVLLAAIIQALDKRDRVFFHFDRRNEAQQPSFRDFLVAIVRQLAAGGRPYCPQLQIAYASRVASQIASEEVLADAVVTMMGSEPRAALAMDALDECREEVREHKLFPLITRLLEVNAHVIATSREIDDIVRFMPPNVTRLRLNRNHHQHATLRVFVDSQLAKSYYELWPAELKREVKEILLESDCMFLWVRLQLERLKHAPTPTAVRAMLHSLPPTLNATYERILRDFTPTNDQFRVTLASRILQCVAVSTTRLSPELVAELLAFEFPPGNEIPIAGRILRYDSELFTHDSEALIRAHCPALLEIAEDDVRFIHVSVLEYLLSADRFTDSSPVPSYAFRTDWAHLTWLQICLSIFEHKLELKLTSLAKDAWSSHLISTTDSFRAELLNRMLTPAPVSLKHQFAFQTSRDDTAIHRSCSAGKTDLIEWLVANDSESVVEARDQWQDSPLHAGAALGHSEIIQLLLKSGAFPAAIGQFNRNPLHTAAQHGHLDAVRLLLTAGTPVDARDKYGNLLIHHAAMGGHPEVIALLLELGSSHSATNNSNETPLHLAAQRGHLDAVRLLLNAGASFDARDKDGNLLIHHAAIGVNADIVTLLLELGAQPSATNMRKQTPLHLAALFGGCEAAQVLLDAGAPVNAQDEDGNSPLHEAALSWHPNRERVVGLLLEHGAAHSATNVYQQMPLHIAAGLSDLGAVRALLDGGALVDVLDQDGHSPMRHAVLRGRSEIVELLQERGASCSATDSE